MKKQIRKAFFSGKQYVKAVKSLLLLVILTTVFGRSAHATISVITATGGTNICSNTAVNGTAPAYTTLGTITLTEGAATDFGSAGAWNVTVTISAPAGWAFNTGATITPGYSPGADITGVTAAFAGGALRLTITGTGNTNLDVVTIPGLQVQPSSVTSANANLTVLAFFGATGLGFPGVNGGDLSLNPQPISGSTSVCATGTTLLTDVTTGGAWTSSNTSLATVSGGTVYGANGGSGTVNINYTVSGCITSHSMTVANAPGAFGGVTSVCVGATTTLSNSTTGGTWTTTPTTIATVTTNTGIVTGVSANTAIITYATSAACPTATVAVTVNPKPTISGTTTLCKNGTTTLSDNIAGGNWSSATTTVATITPAGFTVNGVNGGTSVITCSITATGCSSTATVTVNNPPSAISGTASVCTGATTLLSNSTAGGTWSSSATTIATVGAGTGGESIGGVSAGTAVISYNIAACASATVNVTVTQTPGAIAGNNAVCQGSSIGLSDNFAGGVWTSSNTTIATVTGAGSNASVTGAGGTGVVTITYANGSCSVTHTMTVNATPVTITGNLAPCTGTTSQLSDSPAGGTWSSSVTSVATVNSGTGLVYATTAGNTAVTYTTGAGCTRTTTVTVNPTPDAITGTAHVCTSQSTPLSDDIAGGAWSTANTTLATVDGSGNVYGVNGGSVNITYQIISTGCYATLPFTVNNSPSAIGGTTTICQATSTALSDASTGGAWSSDNTSVATVSGGGVMYGVSGGTANVTYAFGPTCYITAPVTINPLPDTGNITGSNRVCLGSTTTLSDGAAGGVWSSTNTAVATIDPATGMVSGVTLGTTTIRYTVTNGCGTLFANYAMSVNYLTPMVSINANPGITSCVGQPVTYIGVPTNGGTAPVYQWRVNGSVTSASDTFTYTPNNGDMVVCTMISNEICISTPFGRDTIVTVVDPNLAPAVSITTGIVGDTVCVGTLTTYSATPTNGGSSPSYTWYANSSLIGTGNPISYTPANGDTITTQVTSSYQCAVPATATSNKIVMTVNTTEVPAVSITASADPSCQGDAVTFAAHTLYGGIPPFIRWTQNGINVATGPTYTTIPLNGDQFYCVMRSTSTCRTVDSVYSNVITEQVDTPIVPNVTVVATATTVHVGQADTLIAVVTPASLTPTYQWYINGVAIPGATLSYYIPNVTTTGSYYYYCIAGNGNACNTSHISNLITLIVDALGVNSITGSVENLSLIPNPNSGTFTVQGTVSNAQEVTIEVTDIVGQVVYRGSAAVQNASLKQQVILGGDVANGMYMLHVITPSVRKVIRFTLDR